MAREATRIELSEEERQQLESWVRKTTMEQRLVQRARIVLESAAGRTTTGIARSLGLRPATVSKWRTRFSQQRLDGLTDAPRPGRVAVYGRNTEERILAQLDEPPPASQPTWNGRLLAEALDGVSVHQVWRVLRRHGVCLQRRRSWCVSTEPEFAQKAADIVALYLDPPENAVVLSVDEKPAIEAPERAQGWLRLPNGQALRGFSHECKRHSTTTLFSALEVAAGLARNGHCRRRREFLDFMNRVVACYPNQELHVILDDLNIHKPKHDRWLARHPKVHFHSTPTHASWLSQIECWFSILWPQALAARNGASPGELRDAIEVFAESASQCAVPFQWTKCVLHLVGLKSSCADFCT